MPETLVLGLLLGANVDIIPGLMVAFGFSGNCKGYTSIAINSFLNASKHLYEVRNWRAGFIPDTSSPVGLGVYLY